MDDRPIRPGVDASWSSPAVPDQGLDCGAPGSPEREEIEKAIERLPRSEFFKLPDWVPHRFEDEWDKEFQEDAESETLDSRPRKRSPSTGKEKPKRFLPMNSHGRPRYCSAFGRLPKEIQVLAVKQYRLWRKNRRLAR